MQISQCSVDPAARCTDCGFTQVRAPGNISSGIGGHDAGTVPYATVIVLRKFNHPRRVASRPLAGCQATSGTDPGRRSKSDPPGLIHFCLSVAQGEARRDREALLELDQLPDLIALI
jgi:hypothetical protein